MVMSWIHSILQVLVAWTVSYVQPPDTDPDWKLVHGWNEESGLATLTAASTAVPKLCKQSPNKLLETPILVQGAHEIYLDERLIEATTDRAFNRAGNYYNVARVSCRKLLDGQEVRWVAFTRTHTLAQLRRFPRVIESRVGGLFEETANVIVSGTLFGLGAICTLLFYGKISSSVVWSFLISAVCYAINFACWVPRNFMIEVPQSRLQRFSDVFLWLGYGSLGWLLFQIRHCPYPIFVLFVSSCFIGLLGPLFGNTLDQSQVTQNVPFIVGYVFLFGILLTSNFKLTFSSPRGRREIFRLLAVIVFIVTSFNDIAITVFGFPTIPILPLGMLAGIGLLALSVNDRIVETYEERDFLRLNLEREVAKKTEALRTQSAELETALSSLKTTQADLVQSAKLASLGTLSAGIAHEINNALNFVNGSIEPLANLIKKEPFGEIERTKSNKLIGLMREGLQLTFGIIVNLKRHTSTSGTTVETVNPREVAEGVILLLKSRLNGFEVINNIPSNTIVTASQVGLSQVLVNLISNAVDAINEAASKTGGIEKRVTLSAESTSAETILSVTDTGTGIPTEIQERIFDPFFSTKEVGKGTGLGLHIVLSEMKKFGGAVKLVSQQGKGTQFKLVFPNSGVVAAHPKAGAA